MTKIEDQPDGTVKVTWTGKKGRGSLLQIAATGNALNVNKLTMNQCLAVLLSVRSAPFPMGDDNAKSVYRKALEYVETPAYAEVRAKCEAIGIGAVRKTIVIDAGGGFNAPHDMYLGIAVKVLEEMAETPA